jgi:hypothetical protein
VQLRATIKHLGNLAIKRGRIAAKRLRVREIWILLYNRLNTALKFNAIARSVEKGYKHHLDAVQEAGLLPVALHLAARM